MAISDNKAVKSAPENKIVKQAEMKVKSTPTNLFDLLKDDLEASAIVEEAVKAIKEEKELEELERHRKEWEEKEEQRRQGYGGNRRYYGPGSNYSGRSYDQGSKGYRRGGGGGNYFRGHYEGDGGNANQGNSGSGNGTQMSNGSTHRGRRGGLNGESNGRKDGRNIRSIEVSNVSPGDEAQQESDGWTSVHGRKGTKKVWRTKICVESNVSEENAQSDAQPECVKGANKIDDAQPEGGNKVAEVEKEDTVVEKEDAGGDSAEPASSDNKSNVAEGNSVVEANDSQQDSKDYKKKSKKGKFEIEERPQMTEEQQEDYRNRMTLKEYNEKLQAQKQNQLSDSLKRSDERKVTLDKDFETMQLLARKKRQDSPFIKQDSEKGTLKKKDNLNKEAAARKTSMSITEFLKPAQNYGPRHLNGHSFGARDGRWSDGGDRTYNDRQRSNAADRSEGRILNGGHRYGGNQRYTKSAQLIGERANGSRQYEDGRSNNGSRRYEDRKPNVETRGDGRKVGEGNVANVRGENKRPDGVSRESFDTIAFPEVDDKQFPVLGRDAR